MSRNLLRRIAAIAVLWCLSVAATAADFSKTYQTISSWDGTAIAALVLVPENQGEGPFPLVVMPASWSLPNLEYVGRAAEMAADGYVVVSYTSRGFWDSAGQIDIAGAATVEDVSAVIDWALANTPSSESAIGVSGISYGAGTSLLAAERDPRIRAVAALSGWADLEASLYANQTVSSQGVTLLVAAAVATGRLGPELTEIATKVALGDYDSAVQDFLPDAVERSPASAVDDLNSNGAAVLLANAFNDGLFPPNQYVDFYQQLTVDKQLMFSQGDHATAELPGALGLPNEVYDAAIAWFDHYLKGLDNGVDNAPKVRLQTLDGDWLSYDDWADVEDGAATYALGKPALLTGTGGLSSSASSGWSHSILTGIESGADSGVVLATGLLQGLGLPATATLATINRASGGVWLGDPVSGDRQLAGTPALRITVTPSQSNVTLVAYLYRVNALGVGQLLSHKPYSVRDATPGQAMTLQIELEATAATIASGQRLALVIDTLDDRYAAVTSFGGSVTFSSPSATPAQLNLPLH